MACDHPNALQECRDVTTRHANMAGVTSPRRRCVCCQEYKQTGGSKKTEAGFICKDCSEGRD